MSFEETYEKGRIEGLQLAIKEIQGWQDLLIKAHETTPYANPKEALREHRNQMNLLETIESKLRKKAGEGPKQIFNDMKNRRKNEY